MRDMTTAARPSDDTAGFTPVSLTADALSLSRGDTRLAEGLSIQVAPGDAILLTGGNGTGKTTLLRALAGFVEPDAGQVSIQDRSIGDAAADHIAWLGHADGLKPSETVRATLRFWADVYDRPRKAIMPALRDLGIDHLIDRRIDRLSRGQQRRVGLVRVLLSNRPVWLLDEPAGPLDAKARDRLADIVAMHRERQGIVIAATHQSLNWAEAKIFDVADFRPEIRT